jgi:hypothetical protein
MSTTISRCAAALLAALALLGAARAQDTDAHGAAAQKAPTTADKQAAKALLTRLDEARSRGDAVVVSEVLQAMAAHDNAEFFKPASRALAYEAGRADQEAAKVEAEELGLTNSSDKRALLAERETLVVAAAARLIANHPAKRAGPVLLKAFKDGDMRRLRPKAAAALVATLGALGFEQAEKDVRREFNAFREPEIVRACVRYFGQIKSKDMATVRALCEMLSGPQPADVDDPSNPPAAYWIARWKTWSAVRRDIMWAVKEITGQDFAAEDGDRPGDTAKALQYVRDHAKRLGIR